MPSPIHSRSGRPTIGPMVRIRSGIAAPALTHSRRVKSISSGSALPRRRSSAPAPCRRSGRCPALPARFPGPSGRCRARWFFGLFLLLVVAGQIEIRVRLEAVVALRIAEVVFLALVFERRLAGVQLHRHPADGIDRGRAEASTRSGDCRELEKWKTGGRGIALSDMYVCGPATARSACSRHQSSMRFPVRNSPDRHKVRICCPLP
jgi:hypothetical protein